MMVVSPCEVTVSKYVKVDSRVALGLADTMRTPYCSQAGAAGYVADAPRPADHPALLG